MIYHRHNAVPEQPEQAISCAGRECSGKCVAPMRVNLRNVNATDTESKSPRLGKGRDSRRDGTDLMSEWRNKDAMRYECDMRRRTKPTALIRSGLDRSVVLRLQAGQCFNAQHRNSSRMVARLAVIPEQLTVSCRVRFPASLTNWPDVGHQAKSGTVGRNPGASAT